MSEQTVRVHILGREYTLRAPAASASITRSLAAELDERMRAFREAHPTQPEITAAVITALELAEELRLLRQAVDASEQELDAEMRALTARLDEVLDA